MNGQKLEIAKKVLHLHPQYAIAQMAESVDALVSNTSGAIHPGSIPGLGTRKIPNDFLSLGIFFAHTQNATPTASNPFLMLNNIFYTDDVEIKKSNFVRNTHKKGTSWKTRIM